MDDPENSRVETNVAVAPFLSVRNGVAAVEFYITAFGATQLQRLGEEGGQVVAELALGKSRFWVSDESPEHLNFSPETLGGGTVRMVVTVDDPDAAFSRAVLAGGVVVQPVQDYDYGWRVGRMVDPFGHHWEIGRPLQVVQG